MRNRSNSLNSCSTDNSKSSSSSSHKYDWSCWQEEGPSLLAAAPPLQYRRQIDREEESEHSQFFERQNNSFETILRSNFYCTSSSSSSHLNMSSGEEAATAATLPPMEAFHLTSPLLNRQQQQQEGQQQIDDQQQTAAKQRNEDSWNRGGLNNVATIETTFRNNNHNNNALVEDQQNQHETKWVLTLYCPTREYNPNWSQDLDEYNDDDDDVHDAVVIRIHVTGDMTHESWRQCIQHATSQYYATVSAAPIAGLFRKRDYGYFSLEYIWATSSVKTDNNYWLFLPPNVVDPTRRHHRRRGRGHKTATRWWWNRLGWSGRMGVVVVVAWIVSILLVAPDDLAHSDHHHLSHSSWLRSTLYEWIGNMGSYNNTMAWFHRVVIRQPIQDFYRHGPTWLGAWEGMPLSQICVRLSLMGDEDFWKRNMDDCERMYQHKQDAMVHTIQPLVYAGFLYLLWSILKVEYLRRRQNQPDPNMVELYHAFHVVLRQVQRVLSTGHTPGTAAGRGQQRR